MLRAVISAPSGRSPAPLWYEASGVMKFLERWSRMGLRRSSSSSLGSPRAVSCEGRISSLAAVEDTSCQLTSSARSSLEVYSASTMLDCSLEGT